MRILPCGITHGEGGTAYRWRPQRTSNPSSGPFAILESFQQSDDGERSVKEISEALGLNKSTAFGLINTLTSLGYLQQNEKNQKYYLGLRLLNFSNIIKVQNRIIRIVHTLR